MTGGIVGTGSLTGPEVARIRTALGLYQRELADRLGVKVETVAAWESGRNRCKGPAARMLAELAASHEAARLAEARRIVAEADAPGVGQARSGSPGAPQ